MRCEDAQPLLSIDMDEPLGTSEVEALRAHTARCPECAVFARHLAALRRELRYEAMPPVPDVAPAVVAAVQHARQPWWASAAAVFLVGALLGAALIGVRVGEPPHHAAADLPERVLTVQADLHSLVANVEIIERGWHPDVPERTFSGSLAYRAPESLALRLRDVTAYPPGVGWVPNHTTLVIDDDRAWASGPASCPRDLLPACTPAEPRVWAVQAREPFDAGVPVPLDVVVPVRSFVHATPPAQMPSRDVGGRAAIGVHTTAAQVMPLLDGFRRVGMWRDVHPTDRARVWLDAERLVPLIVELLPADDPDRQLWAARHGYDDPPGLPVLEIRLTDVRVNEPVDDARFPAPPAGAAPRDLGFVETAVDLQPGWLPDGMRPHRQGRTASASPAEVRSWTDGQAWIAVRRVTSPPPAASAALAAATRHVDLPRGGVASVSEGGAVVALHTGTHELVVAGSVGEEILLRVADELGVVGRPVSQVFKGPADVEGLLAPVDLPGYASPEALTTADGVVVRYRGPGGRAFVLTQIRDQRLSPPLGPDVRGVQVRGTVGRWTPALSTLEWVEDGWVMGLRSETLSVAELVDVAERLTRR